MYDHAPFWWFWRWSCTCAPAFVHFGSHICASKPCCILFSKISSSLNDIPMVVSGLNSFGAVALSYPLMTAAFNTNSGVCLNLYWGKPKIVIGEFLIFIHRSLRPASRRKSRLMYLRTSRENWDMVATTTHLRVDAEVILQIGENNVKRGYLYLNNILTGEERKVCKQAKCEGWQNAVNHAQLHILAAVLFHDCEHIILIIALFYLEG